MVGKSEFLLKMSMATLQVIWQEAETRALFAALDKDSNGFIDKNELRTTMSEVGLQLTDDDVDTMMKAAGVVIKDRIFYEGQSVQFSFMKTKSIIANIFNWAPI